LRPLYSGYLDGETAPEPSRLELVPAPRAFLGLRDLGRAATFLGELATLGKFLTVGLGLRRDNLAEVLRDTVPGAVEVKLEDLLGTMIANLLLDRPPVFVPIPRADLQALRRAAYQGAPSSGAGNGLPEKVQRRIRETLVARVRERSVSEAEAAELFSPPSERLLQDSLRALARGLSALPDAPFDAVSDMIPRVEALVLA
jgi:hypothetical protein